MVTVSHARVVLISPHPQRREALRTLCVARCIAPLLQCLHIFRLHCAVLHGAKHSARLSLPLGCLHRLAQHSPARIEGDLPNLPPCLPHLHSIWFPPPASSLPHHVGNNSTECTLICIMHGHRVSYVHIVACGTCPRPRRFFPWVACSHLTIACYLPMRASARHVCMLSAPRICKLAALCHCGGRSAASSI